MKPGKYEAKIVGAGVLPDKNNQPQPFMKFETSEGPITWYGSLKSQTSQEIAVKAAVAAGFTGNDWDDFAQGLVHFKETKFVITVAEETYNGKTRLKVKWVNPIGEAKAMSAVEVKSKISSAGLFAKEKKDSGVKPSGSDSNPF